MVKKRLCYKTEGGIITWIDKELYEEIKELQEKLEKIYGRKVSFRAASKFYVGFKK